MSASTATAGFGTLFKHTPIGGALTTIAEVTDISGPGLGADTIEVTHHESPAASTNHMGAREFIGGLADGGEVTLSLNFLPGNSGHASLLGAVGARAAQACSITFPDTGAGAFTFNAFVTGFDPKAPVDDKLSADVTLKVTGLVTYTP